MENRIDQVFKEKLTEHKVAPSAEAWEKINTGLSKKNKLVIMWRMAAVLILVGVSVGAWYILNPLETTDSNLVTHTEDRIKPETKTNEIVTESIHENVKPTHAQANKKITKKTTKPTDQLLTESDKVVENKEVDTYEIEAIILDQEASVEEILITQTAKPEKPIVIEFTLKPTEKSPVAQVAQVKEEENTGLKKILEAARDMKNGDSEMSSIRDTKNQLFALDFRKDKQKVTNQY